MDVIELPIGDAVLDPENVRRHDDRNIKAIADSLTRFGQVTPIVIDGRGVIAKGNGTVMAARSLGWESVKAVRTELIGDEARAYAIADNRASDLASFDDDALIDQLKALGSVDEDLRQAAGFSAAEVAELIASVEGPVVPVEDDGGGPPPSDPVTRRGDLILMGEHRLLCGDSTRGEDVARVMGGERATCVFTDPPYGVSVGAKNRLLNSVQPSGRCLEDIASDDMNPDELKAMLLPAFISLRENVMAEDCTLFVSAPQGGELGMMMMMMMEAGLRTRHVLIWKKNQPTFSLGRLDYDYQHEPILLTWGKRHKRPMKGEHRTSVWEVDRERKCDVHPTMKPVALYANAYANNSDPGDNVADIYAGSGTAFIAAEQLGRRCFGIEISPAYCDVIVDRWQRLTGRGAIRPPRDPGRPTGDPTPPAVES